MIAIAQLRLLYYIGSGSYSSMLGPAICTSSSISTLHRTYVYPSQAAVDVYSYTLLQTTYAYTMLCLSYYCKCNRYGRLEIEAKLPKGDWIKPLISLLPARNVYGAWPASGEITLLQSRGNNPGYANGETNGEGNDNVQLGDVGGGSETVSSIAHWGPHWRYVCHYCILT
jgi:hypothetical protein